MNLTKAIVHAVWNYNKIEDIYYQNPNHLKACRSNDSKDFCELLAFGGATQALYNLAELPYEYDHEEGFELYAALCQLAYYHKITAHNPTRMIRVFIMAILRLLVI